jgi:glycerate-2-kinase
MMEALIIATLILVIGGCTVVYVQPHGKGGENAPPIAIQTNQNNNALGTQNSTSAPRSAKGDAGGAVDTDSTAVTPVTITPLVKP